MPVFPLRCASLNGTKRDSAARGPLQTAAAAQHRHGAGGRRALVKAGRIWPARACRAEAHSVNGVRIGPAEH